MPSPRRSRGSPRRSRGSPHVPTASPKGAVQVARGLTLMGFGKYARRFEQCGYNDMDELRSMDVEHLRAVAEATRMAPQDKLKFFKAMGTRCPEPEPAPTPSVIVQDLGSLKEAERMHAKCVRLSAGSAGSETCSTASTEATEPCAEVAPRLPELPTSASSRPKSGPTLLTSPKCEVQKECGGDSPQPKCEAPASTIAALKAELRELREKYQELEARNVKICDEEHLVNPKESLGDLLHKVNHVAITVEDVGRSAAFYTEVIGLREVGRPNFDRHGAWFSLGTGLSLHLIKGVPSCRRNADGSRFTENDLVCAHTSIEVPTATMPLIEERLQTIRAKKQAEGEDFWWRQNMSVPGAAASKSQKFETAGDEKGKVMQFFLQDPDGYWIEICNCEILAGLEHGAEVDYDEATVGKNMAEFGTVGATFGGGRKWARRARRRASALHAEENRGRDQKVALLDSYFEEDIKENGIKVPAEAADEARLANLKGRRATWCDVTQGFTDEELEGFLIAAGNNIPACVLLLKKERLVRDMGYQPPPFKECGEMKTADVTKLC